MNIEFWENVFAGQPRKFTDMEGKLARDYATWPLGCVFPQLVENFNYRDFVKVCGEELIGLSQSFYYQISDNEFESAKQTYEKILDFELT